ncbi:c-type cytochrome [Pseudomonas sp. N040]|uniref:c-type cytochrome n=1 Tax=Pseudomonas sp. N040 TaxID=2785325 RepID=UPI001C61665A|nr:cytochrome c [Pseudomonas sp. N040]MBW7013667.1 cytochrome c [Pseudomonas sp. N040]
MSTALQAQAAAPAPAPAPAPAQTQVQQGEYLARAGDCTSCHTAQNGQPFAGGFRLDTPFGYLLAPNITPDQQTGIGNWSADDFYRALHAGVNKKGQYLFPAMPYTSYTKVTRADSDALFAYLMSLPPVSNAVEVNHLQFPFNLRLSMLGWNELYFNKGSYQPDPKQTPAWNRGAYLVEGLGHCSECHSPRNVLGGIEQKKTFTGADIDGWFALNLTGNLKTGLGQWSVTDIATYLKTGADKSKSTTLGPMAEVVHNSLGFMTEDDLLAMAEYLKTLPASSAMSPDYKPDTTLAAGATTYVDNCSACHQAQGTGIPGVFPPLAGNPVVLAADANDILKVVLFGIPVQGGYIAMPGFGDKLNDQQIADLANYLRSSWGNGAAANATAAQVAVLRKTPVE